MSSVSYWEYHTFILLRPLFAIALVVLFIAYGWYLAWMLVLVHVSLVQEIFGLKKKPVSPKPVSLGRFSEFYRTMETQNSGSKGKQSLRTKGEQGGWILVCLKNNQMLYSKVEV